MSKTDAIFRTMIDGEMCGDDLYYAGEGEQIELRVDNPDAESGYPKVVGPLSWLNSASIELRPDYDEVNMYVSVGDPRGAFAFTVRRLNDGRIVIHTPYPGESRPHVRTQYLHGGLGTMVLVGDDDQPIHFTDEDEDGDEDGDDE